ncbi:ATP-dependent DNA helicase RecG [soil metagenome]
MAGDTAQRSVPGVETGDGLLDQRLAKSGLVAPGMARNLARLGVISVRDLLFHLPRRYDDFSQPVTLRELRQKPPEAPVSAVVEIADLRVEAGFRRRVQRTIARVRDETGEGEAVWFGRRYIERRLATGQTVALSGKVELRGWLPSFKNPEFGPADESALHAGRIVPVYRLTAGVTGPTLRQRVRDVLTAALPHQAEYLSADLRRAAGADELIDIGAAIEAMHFPSGQPELEKAFARLAFDELLALQLGMVARRRQRQTERSMPVVVGDARFREAIGTVEQVIGEQVARRRLAAGDGDAEEAPVTLTEDQLRALEEVRADIAVERPMMRLLQGDVGSGKTAVAALALCFFADAGHQAALLAPTDLLARQHVQTLGRLLEPLGHEVTLLTGSLPAATRRAALEQIAAPLEQGVAGRTMGRIVVGTHALVQEGVSFADLRLTVVDEQHRFGVAQREALAGKGGAPHVLLMTATPIPRTLSLIVHGDLDVSDLRTPPAGRQEIRTAIRSSAELIRRADGKQGAIGLIATEIAAGRRAFVVVPLVDDDPDAAARSVDGGRALVEHGWDEAARVAGVEHPLPVIESVHGQLKAAERDKRMERFRSGEAQIVVGTTVLEVGVDVPEATVMMILDADRFGLAQLHQLRGRVGRGEAQSYCVLVSDRYPRDDQRPADDEQAAVAARLNALAATADGFVLAELDLDQRREGELLGLSQSGLPPLRVASLARKEHQQLSLRARELAEELLDERGRLPDRHAALEHEITRGWLRQVGAGDVVSGPADA